jgi:hypothetical protein
MSYAPDYMPGTSFANDEANNVAGRSLVKTDSLDSELANISTSINDLNGNLQALQRDDNKLKDGIIEPYSLSEQTRAIIATQGGTPRGNWSPNTVYYFKDIIQRNNIAQICQQQEPHNSGTVFVQSFWLPISGDGTSAANAAAAVAAANEALSSQTAAESAAALAASSESAASTSATSAATSATNASNSASSANTSATNAANSAAEAAQSVIDVNNVIAASTVKASQADAIAGVNDSKYMTPLTTRQAYPIRTLMTAWSSAYTPTGGETLSAAHGQSVVPYAVQLVLECVSADLGYSVGDRVTPHGFWNGSATNAISYYADATNVGVKCPTGFIVYIQSKTSGSGTTPAAGKWKYAFEFKV